MKKTPTRGPRTSIRPPVLALIKPGQAYTFAGIAACVKASRTALGNALHRMCISGQLAKLKIGPDVLYFASASDADAFGAAERQAFSIARLEQRRASLTGLSKKGHEARAKLALRCAVVPAKEARPAPVTITCTRKSWADRPVDMSRAVVTVAQTPKPRFWIDPADRVVGGFATAGIGRYE